MFIEKNICTSVIFCIFVYLYFLLLVDESNGYILCAKVFDFVPLLNVWHALMLEDCMSAFSFFIIIDTTLFSKESCSSSGAFSPSVDSFGALSSSVDSFGAFSPSVDSFGVFILRTHDLCLVLKPLITILSCLLYCSRSSTRF